MRGLRITEPWNAARQTASNTEGIALDRIGLIQVDLEPDLVAQEHECREIALGAIVRKSAMAERRHQLRLQEDGLLGRAFGFGKPFEAIAGNDRARGAIEAETGPIVKAGDLFQTREAVRWRGGGKHGGSP